MTLADWTRQMIQRFQEESAMAAVRQSGFELAEGARKRMQLLRARVRGRHLPLAPAPSSPAITVEGFVDLRRAEHLNGEEALAAFLLSGIDEGTVFWDVGAHHGHYSVLAAAAGAQVRAFEPQPASRAVIKRNRGLGSFNEQIRIEDVALSDTAGPVAMAGPRKSMAAIEHGADGEFRAIRGDSLDPQPDVLKIDVEGHECAVLDGLGDRLEMVSHVGVEVHDNSGAVRDRLVSAGFDVTELGTKRQDIHLGAVRK